MALVENRHVSQRLDVLFVTLLRLEYLDFASKDEMDTRIIGYKRSALIKWAIEIFFLHGTTRKPARFAVVGINMEKDYVLFITKRKISIRSE